MSILRKIQLRECELAKQGKEITAIYLGRTELKCLRVEKKVSYETANGEMNMYYQKTPLYRVDLDNHFGVY